MARASKSKRENREESLLRFFRLSGGLKTEKRKGWVRVLKETYPESVADHSYRTALMAMVYSDLHGLDTGRAVKIAILHDLPESLVGDTVPGELPRREKRRREDSAMEELLSNLPDSLAVEYRTLWRDHLNNRSAEAKLVSQLDKLELAVQAEEYLVRGYDATTMKSFFETARKALVDKDLMNLFRANKRAPIGAGAKKGASQASSPLRLRRESER